MNGSLESNTIPDNVRTAAPSTGKKPENRARKDLTQEEVRKHLNYNPETGELMWREWRRGRKTSLNVGRTQSNGYMQLQINGTLYQLHRVIWLWVYGYFPENEIDHINRVRSDNRLSNLREVSRTCNARNCGIDPRNKTGVKGIYWETKRKAWLSSIKANDKRKHLGRFKDFTEAVAHRLAAEQCLDWAGCDSNSPAYQYMKNYVRR